MAQYRKASFKKHRLLALTFLVAALCGAAPVEEAIDRRRARPDPDGETLWYDIRQLGVEGQGWSDTKAPFDRLPARAEGVVRPPVWDLSRHSAGLCVRFMTDAPAIRAHWRLTSPRLAMPHMPATGVSGLDLYVRPASGQPWRWLGIGAPTAHPANTAPLATGMPPGRREYLLYLPLYNGVASVEIGLARSSTLWRAPPRPVGQQRPIVFYGTSITQGGCASRPGMVHTAILGRRYDRAVINLGFSGNGRMEPEMAQLLAELDAAVYVIDCLPNMSAADVSQRTRPLVETLRRARPSVPIVLVEDRSYTNSYLVSSARQRNVSSREALRRVYDRLIFEGADQLYYLPGENLLGNDTEGTVDSSHPTDLGFVRQADAFQTILTPILSSDSGRDTIEGYTDQLSYQAGDEIKFHISSPAARYNLEIARLGAERKVVAQARDLPGKKHPIPANASSHGCRWPIAYTLHVPRSWKSGYYTCKLQAQLPGGKSVQSEVFFVVRSWRPGQDAKILLQLCTNTYNAYCNWGGFSLYAFNGRNGIQGRRVSFNRPLRGDFAVWELPFVQWAERAGYHIDFAVNSDLEFHPELLRHYRLILSVGHDEYWSAAMRDNLEQFVAQGGNVAFFSGNTCCWQVRSADSGRALVCWKQAYEQDPYFADKNLRLLSTLWSHHLVERPENRLTGVGFLYGGYHLSHGQFMQGSGAFSVHRPEHWIFDGTNLKRGSSFGGKDTIVGYECDGCEYKMVNGLPMATHRDGTPASFQILATAPARWHPDDCEWYEKWEKGRTGSAVLGIYTQGGTVVTAGTTDWSHGLRGNDPSVIRITRNILDRLSR